MYECVCVCVCLWTDGKVSIWKCWVVKAHHSRAFLENSAGVIGNANVNGEQYVQVVEALVPLGDWLEKGTIY